MPELTLHKINFYERHVKRILDMLFSLAVLVLLCPFFLLCMLAIKLDDINGTIFFKQDRNGKDGKVFTILKFRTMRRDLCGKRIEPTIDTLTGIGKLMRKLSFDEIPQLFNIISGDMSLIGPRPLLLSYYEWFNKTERRRFNVHPGITGLSQINGRGNLNWDERFSLDVQYVDNLSFLLDLKIFFSSFSVVFSHKDVFPDDNTVLESFDVYRKSMLGQKKRNAVIQSIHSYNNIPKTRPTVTRNKFARDNAIADDADTFDVGVKML